MHNKKECTVCNSLSCFSYDHPEADIYTCKKCKHSFSILKEGVEENYSDEYFLITHKNWFENPNFKLFEALSSIVENDDSSVKVMDVGCGNLDFLKYLRKKYSEIDLNGIDFSEQKPVLGINFIKDDFLKHKNFSKYDFVYSIMTIEHINNINHFTQTLHSIVKPGGLLIITTINQSSTLYLASLILRSFGIKKPFQRLYSKHHLNHFSNYSLQQLITLNHFSIESVLWHNVPLKSLDIPASNFFAKKILTIFVILLFLLGKLFNRTYSQTVIAKRVS